MMPVRLFKVLRWKRCSSHPFKTETSGRFCSFTYQTKIRLQTLRFILQQNIRGLPEYILYLLANETCRPLLQQSLVDHEWDASLETLFALCDENLISGEIVLRIVARKSIGFFAHHVVNSTSYDARTIDKILNEPLITPATKNAPPSSNVDMMQRLIELMAEQLFFSAESSASDSLDCDPILGVIETLRRLLRDTVKSQQGESPIVVKRFVAGVFQTAKATGIWDPQLLQTSVAEWPDTLTKDQVPLALRQESVAVFYQLSTSTRPCSLELFDAILCSDLVRQPDGLPDLWVIGGLLFLRKKRAYKQLQKLIDQDQIVAAYAKDPQRSASLFAKPDPAPATIGIAARGAEVQRHCSVSLGSNVDFSCSYRWFTGS